MTEAIRRFVDEHPEVVNFLVGFVVTYVLASVKSWPPPSDPRWQGAWRVFVHALFLSWDRWGGRFRVPFVTPIDEPPANDNKAQEDKP